jgi:hypothetical protein
MNPRHVYFAFDLERDLHRVNQIRGQLIGAEVGQVGFFDAAEYAELARRDKPSIRRAIRERVAGTSVTLVLIGPETASRPFVHLGIEESIANQNGFLGIHVHAVDDQDGQVVLRGSPPILPLEIAFPCDIWDWNLVRLQEEIEAAGRRADRWRLRTRVRGPEAGR